MMLSAQAPEVEWFKGQGTNTEEHVHEGMQTSDGGYIAIGHGIESSDADDMLIIKIDADGNLEWKQDFGTAGKPGAGYCVAEISDGYITGGAIYDSNSQRTQRFLAKLDLAGNVVWERFYAAAGVGGIRGIDLTSDGGLVATGYIHTPNIDEFRGFVFIVDEGDGFIMQLDTAGNVAWEQLIDAPQGTKVREIAEGYAVCSTVWNWTPAAGDHQDFCLIETDSQGNTVWQKYYGGNEGDHLYDFDLTKDGGYILGGHTMSYGVNNWDYLLLKVDGDGNEEWHQTFGQPRGYDADYIHDEAYGVRQTPDGGYIIAGGSGDEYSYSASGHPAGPSGEWKAYLVRTDSIGNMLWEGIYPTTSVGNNAAEYIGLTSDGGYIVFVDTDSQAPPDPNNFGFLKIAAESVAGTHTPGAIPPIDFGINQNYPNPFNPSTKIPYTLQRSGVVNLTIYDLQGSEVIRLVDGYTGRGNFEITWHGQSAAGEAVSSGIYFARLVTPRYSRAIKMVVMR
jgi:hypothetical protein